ncbi:MAG: signal peptide peptidase SppA, partial [Spirochaetia bacterium]|nr:signal peptide peptidase SppA [Spirochaetia bacterium]
NYYGKGMERFNIKVNVFKTGDYKSAVEPFTSEGMSRFAREASADYLGDLWGEYLSGIASERGITKKQLENYAADYAVFLARSSGSSSDAAKGAHLIDESAVYDDAQKLAGEGLTISLEKYYKLVKNREIPGEKRIAVVTASGNITGGNLPRGMIGSDTYTSIFDRIREDDKISAVVLRIDSGGGGAGASEEIRRALQKVRESGKPVVVSMSSVAASGAYWISTASDAILCMPSTLTGSIGVFAVLPDFSEFLERYPGVTTDGYGTTPYSHLYRADMSMTDDMKKVLQLSVERDYSYFLSLVSASRGITVSEAKKAAAGRVWSGKDAEIKKLVDGMGSLEDAISLAAQKCGCEGKDYSVKYYEPEDDWRVSLMKEFSYLSESSNGGKRDESSLYDSLLKAAAKILSMFPGPLEYENNMREDFYRGGIQALYTGDEYIVM